MIMRSVSIALALLFSACTAGNDSLSHIHAGIISDLPAVTHIGAEDIRDPSELILLDIREPEEYAVSHLPDAIQIDPNISEAGFLTKIGNVTDRDIVVYCSVGRRSSIFADRMSDALMAQGARSVSNLENGIFGWHNEKRDLVDVDGPTDAVHPYNEIWKRYVTRKDKAAYTPQ